MSENMPETMSENMSTEGVWQNCPINDPDNILYYIHLVIYNNAGTPLLKNVLYNMYGHQIYQ